MSIFFALPSAICTEYGTIPKLERNCPKGKQKFELQIEVKCQVNSSENSCSKYTSEHPLGICTCNKTINSHTQNLQIQDIPVLNPAILLKDSACLPCVVLKHRFIQEAVFCTLASLGWTFNLNSNTKSFKNGNTQKHSDQVSRLLKVYGHPETIIIQNVLSFTDHLQYYLPLLGILWCHIFLPNDFYFFQLSTTGCILVLGLVWVFLVGWLVYFFSWTLLLLQQYFLTVTYTNCTAGILPV